MANKLSLEYLETTELYKAEQEEIESAENWSSSLDDRLERIHVHEDRRSTLSHVESNVQHSDSSQRQQRRNTAHSSSIWRRLHGGRNHPVTRNSPEGSGPS